MLRRGDFSRRQTIQFNPRDHSEFTFHVSHRTASLGVWLAALVTLLYPAVKIIAAGLYEPFLSHETQVCTATE